jgi:cell division protein FtsL
MSNLARKLQQQKITHNQQRPTPQPKVKKLSKVTPLEKILYLMFIFACCFIGTKIVKTQATIFDTNYQIQQMNKDISLQKEQNQELKMKIDELSTYDRIWGKAKELGLKLDNKNVKLTEGN